MRYIDRIVGLIEEQIAYVDNFGLIKLENFQNPNIYLEVCLRIKEVAKHADIIFLGKLSRERYLEWRKDSQYKDVLDKLYDAGYVEETGSLTKWRNDSFLSSVNEKVLIILMGTELVVDKGGLADFYTISPETIEKVVGTNYSSFFHSMSSDIIDNIYINLFYYIEKDLYRLDRFANDNYDIIHEGQIIQYILENLDEEWGFPNLNTLVENSGTSVLSNKGKRIKIFEKAHKFNRRISMDNLPSPRKLDELKKKIDNYYEKYSGDLDNEFDRLFSGYDDYGIFKLDIIDYYSGINVDDIRNKLIKCDFVTIDKIIGLKIKDTNQTEQTKNKDIKVYGNPISSIYIPFIKMYLDLDIDEREQFSIVDFTIEEIKLANVSHNESDNSDNLYNKWNQMRRFINGIENIINTSYIKDLNDDLTVNFSAFSFNNEPFYPFSKENIPSLLYSDILKEASLRDSVSKITFVIELKSDVDSKLRKDRFIWYIFDTDPWTNAFDIIDKASDINENKVDEISSYLPIGVCGGLESAVGVTNIDEFHEIYERLEIDYNSCAIDPISMNSINVKSYEFGKKFIQMLRSIEMYGFFSVLKNHNFSILVDYLNAYRELIKTLLDNISNTTLESKICELSKTMTIISKPDDINKKGAQITMFPAYHPVMLEKIMQRYIYLCMGIDELLQMDLEEIEIDSKLIDKRYSMLDQLATITSATGATINELNRFDNTAQTFGYSTIFGKVNDDTNDVNINVSYTKEDDELENVSSKLIATPVSRYIEKTISNYLSIYPYKIDGIKIMFFNPRNFSDIIAAFKGIVENHKKEKNSLKLELVIYTDDYRCKVYNYLKSWIDNNISEDDSIILTAKIKYFDYRSGNSQRVAEESIQNGDITFMFKIMEEVELREEPVYVHNGIDTMYPSTYLPIPKNDNDRRFIAISQLQFECEEIYTQLVANIKNPHIIKGSYQIFKESRLRNQFIDIIKVLHNKSNWVVVLDENIDPSLIKFTGNEIIGYSTGEGYFGELNATISSSSAILNDIERYLIKRMKAKFVNWNNDEIKEAARRCIEYAYELDGAEVLKAINPNDEAINNYLAFYLSTIIVQESFDENEYYYRKLLSLDLYDQLFEGDTIGSGYLHVRPDFLLIEIPKENNSIDDGSNLKIKIHIIECKMGSSSYMSTMADHAKEQVYAGYKTLKCIWKNPNGVKKRYWQNQLYKILTLQNSIKMTSEELDLYAKKVMHIFNENYDVEFSNYIYSFSLEQDEDFVKNHFYKGTNIRQVNYGSSIVKKLLLRKESDNILDFVLLKQEVEDKEVISFIEEKEESNAGTEMSYGSDDETISNVKDQINASEDIFGEVAVTNELEENELIPRFIYQDEFINFFKSYNVCYSEEENKDIRQKLDRLEQELKLRKIKIFIKGFVFGPDIIRIELDLATGVNIDQFRKYDNDMKYWLSINEKPFIYIKDGKIMMDIIRGNRQIVGLKNMFEEITKSNMISDCQDRFYTLLGADILGKPQLIDFSDSNTPHLLVAGQTGSGKSVLLNSMLLSIMMMYTPDEVEMILVDPKFIELTVFSDSPYTKVVATEAEQAVSLLEGLVEEMNLRYKTFMETKSKSISSYNSKVENNKKMKRVLMVFDEYAALMEENKDIAKRLESAIKILSQKARAAGIHLIICTQSPRADIITTTIRNNLTARVGLRVADSVASGLILDTTGAETLLGKGDMLLKTAASSELLRAKSPFVTEEEIEVFIEKCQEVYNS